MTLRRNLRQKFLDILHEHTDYVNFSIHLGYENEVRDKIIDKLADAAIEILNDKPKVDLKNSDPAWTVLMGEEINKEWIENTFVEKEALDTFERDMGVPGNWNWYPARTSEDKAWKVLREFVVEKYKENKKCFQTYQTWRIQPYARGAMSNLAIKRNPENFPASWTDFLASNAMYGKSEHQTDTWELDENGTPMSY